FAQNVYLLSGQGASVDAYIARTKDIYQAQIPPEVARLAKVFKDTVRQKDSVMVGLFESERAGVLARQKFDVLAARQLAVEAQQLQAERTLADYGPK
ncbi:MAG: hypothetical protein ACHQ4G_03990, partial [Opitutales bacterium]